jgi:carbamoyl-phosphate synthase large subunit
MTSKTLSIAVTGVGGGVGQSIAKALSHTDYRIVGMDAEPLATGLYAVPSSYIIPYAREESFVRRLLQICEKENCRLLFPGYDVELPILSRNVQRFEAIGTRVIVSSPDAVEASNDKFRTYTVLRELGVSIPYTVDLESFIPGSDLPMPLPFILKPRIDGARSKDVYLVRDEKTFRTFEKDPALGINRFIAQDYIEGEEYTCGTVTLEGRHIGTIVMRRILRNGDTYKCFSVKDPRIEEEIEKIVAGINPVGCLNVQLRVKNGIPYVLELNARCSGTTAARALAGFNEPKMVADFYLKGMEPTFSFTEISVLRYWNELVVDNAAIVTMRESGHLEMETFGTL